MKLQWARSAAGHDYSIHALDYSICKIGSAHGWTFEVWKGRAQLKVGLRDATRARAWCQRYHDRQPQGNANADAEQTAV